MGYNENGDGLSVQKFKSESSVAFKTVNPETPNKITKNNKNGKGWTLIPIALGVAIVSGFMSSVIEDQTHERVEHIGDYESEGILHHGHKLSEEYFVQDYKFVNPLATTEDVYEAFKNGEYDEYQAGDKGNINIESELQTDDIEKNPDYYNKECVSFAKDYETREEIMKNQR